MKVLKCREQSKVGSDRMIKVKFIYRHTSSYIDDLETGDNKQQKFYDFVGREG